MVTETRHLSLVTVLVPVLAVIALIEVRFFKPRENIRLLELTVLLVTLTISVEVATSTVLITRASELISVT